MKTLFASLIACLLPCMAAFSQSHYASYLNDFAPFLHNAAIADDCNMQRAGHSLIISNNFSNDLIITDTIATGQDKFKFYARIANLHNAENKTYKYTDTTSRKTLKTSNTAFGLVWGYTDSFNFHAVILRCIDTNPYDDLTAYRRMAVNIIKVANGKTSILKTVEIDKGVDLYTGFNVVNVEYDGQSTSVAVGDKVPIYIAQIEGTSYPANAQYGILAGPASRLEIERIVLKKQPIMKLKLGTAWTMQSLTQHFDQSSDAYEGFWTFFDKNLDETKLKTGGRYTVALVKNGDGYDIIYVDGAQVNQQQWTCGMLKGHITPSRFIDNYSLTWYDAMMRPFSNDVYATIENFTLLTLHFPHKGGYLRFAKAL